MKLHVFGDSHSRNLFANDEKSKWKEIFFKDQETKNGITVSCIDYKNARSMRHETPTTGGNLSIFVLGEVDVRVHARNNKNLASEIVDNYLSRIPSSDRIIILAIQPPKREKSGDVEAHSGILEENFYRDCVDENGYDGRAEITMFMNQRLI